MNWHITFAPSRALPGDDTPLTASVEGATITLCGQTVDLGVLQDGQMLPDEDGEGMPDCPWITGLTRRIGDTIHITLLLPHGPDAPEETLYPEPVTMTADGEVPVPPFTTTDPEPNE